MTLYGANVYIEISVLLVSIVLRNTCFASTLKTRAKNQGPPKVLIGTFVLMDMFYFITKSIL